MKLSEDDWDAIKESPWLFRDALIITIIFIITFMW